MQIEYRTTKKDLLEFYIFQLKKRAKGKIVIVVVIALFFAFCIGGQPFVWWKSVLALALFPLIWAIPYFIYWCRIEYLFAKKLPFGIKLDDEITLTTSNEGLVIKLKNYDKTTLIEWPNIISYSQSDKAIYLKTHDKTSVLIPKRYFINDSLQEFLNAVKNRFSTPEYWYKNELLKSKKPPYWMGFLCLIPLIGFFAGIVLIVKAVNKYDKNKKLIFMGIGGIIITIALYGSLIMISMSDNARQGFEPFTRTELNTLMKTVEFYKIQHGVYPDSLKEATENDPLVSISDPLQKKDGNYNYIKIGNKYRLFSSGVDGIPNTADDIYPKMDIADTSKFGLILK